MLIAFTSRNVFFTSFLKVALDTNEILAQGMYFFTPWLKGAVVRGGRTRSHAHNFMAVAVNANIWTTFWHCSLVSKANIPQFLVQSYRTPSCAFIVS